MINITFKAKHYYFIVSQLKDIPASQYFDLLNNIKTNTVGVADTVDVTISVSISNIVSVFNILALKPEGQTNKINTEMSNLLLAQIMANITPSGTTVTTEVTVQEPILDPVTGEITGYQNVTQTIEVPAPKTEWDILAEEIDKIRNKNWAITDYAIILGKIFLHPETI